MYPYLCCLTYMYIDAPSMIPISKHSDFNFMTFTRPVGISETEAVDEAIALSLLEFQDTDESEVIENLSQKKTNESSLQNKVMAHVEKVLTGDTRNIVVSRLRIWETAKDYFKRRSFMSKTGILKVTFATGNKKEDAIDHGGPRREFLHLLLGAVCNDSSTLTSMQVL